MKKVAEYFFKVLFKFTFFTIICFSGCKKSENPIPFPIGSFPDTVINLGDINSASDDYNLDLYKIYGNNSLIFSSNRGSSGGQFNLIQGTLSFQFDKKTGLFGVGAKIGNDPFLIKLLEKANTTGNDLGPMTLFSSTDGFDYLFLSSLNSNGNLDFYYLKNRPVFGTNLPEVLGPYPVKLLNSNSDDAYLCFDSNQDTIYFSSNRGGNFDIFYHKRPSETNIDTWFNRDFSSSFLIDSINGSSEDKCPIVFKDIMVYASDRIGGMGGFDLYYSKFIKGRWSSPVNFGPKINTESDEYRPVIGNYRDFSNQFMMFSSNRPGGKGGFDLYFTGVEFFR